MTAALGLVALFAVIGAPDAPRAIVVGERTPAAVIVALPRGAAPTTPVTELSRAAIAAARARTGLDLRVAEQAGLDAEALSRCERATRLSCWLASAKDRPIAAILVINVLPVAKGRDRLTLTLVDVKRAVACTSGVIGEGGEASEVVEDCIWERSAKTEPIMLEASEPAALVDLFSERFEGELAALLDGMGELAPFGRIALDAKTAAVELRVDGALAATLDGGPVMLDELRPGRRVLALSRPGYASQSIVVHVDRARTATAAVGLVSLDASSEGGGRRALFWTGVSAAAVGTALGVWAIARSSAVETTCLAATPNAPCESLGAPTFASTTAELPTTDREHVSPSGVPITVPAALLLGAGAGWLLGTTLDLDDRSTVPWRALLVGLGAGALGATTAALLDPR